MTVLFVLKTAAELGAGATLGTALYDALLHIIMMFKDPEDRVRHFVFAGLRIFYSVVMGILLWYVVIPAPLEAWSSPQAWSFSIGLLGITLFLFGASTYTYREFAHKTADPNTFATLERRVTANEAGIEKGAAHDREHYDES